MKYLLICNMIFIVICFNIWHSNPSWYPEISGMSWGAKISDFGPLCPPPLVVIGLSWCKFGQSAIQMMTSSQLWRTGRMAYKVQIPIFWWDMVMCEKTILVYWIVKTTSVICVCHCALCSHVLQNFLFSDIISTNYSLCQVSCFIFCLSSIFPDIFHWLLLTLGQSRPTAGKA